MRFRKASSSAFIGLDDSGEADLLGMGGRVLAVRVVPAAAGAYHEQLNRGGHRPIQRTNATTQPRKSMPISNVSRVMANSGVPGLSVTSSPPASNMMNSARRNA